MCGASESNRINTVTLQCSYVTINSPVQAWRATFVHSILNYIIIHTNKYVEDRCKYWSIRNCSDITTFICIIVLKVIFKIENGNPLIGSLIIHYWITQWQKYLLQETRYIELFGIFIFSLFWSAITELWGSIPHLQDSRV